MITKNRKYHRYALKIILNYIEISLDLGKIYSNKKGLLFAC